MSGRAAWATVTGAVMAATALSGMWIYRSAQGREEEDHARPPAYAGHVLERIPTRRHVAALTFDAGANADAVPSILATLAHEQVPATFFLTGTWVRRYPEHARQIAARYPVGNHTMTHPHLPTLGDAAVRRELTDARAAIREVTGVEPRPLFRFPYGELDQRTLRLVNDDGYTAIGWTVDTLGWKGTAGGMTPARVVSRVRAAARPGVIVLMHVGSHPTDHSMLDADALPWVIRELRGPGYQLVDLRTALAAPTR